MKLVFFAAAGLAILAITSLLVSVIGRRTASSRRAPPPIMSESAYIALTEICARCRRVAVYALCIAAGCFIVLLIVDAVHIEGARR